MTQQAQETALPTPAPPTSAAPADMAAAVAQFADVTPQEGQTLDDAIAGAINAALATITQPLPLADLLAFLDQATSVDKRPLSLAIEDRARGAPGSAADAARMIVRLGAARYAVLPAESAAWLRAQLQALVDDGVMGADVLAAAMALFPTETVPLHVALGFEQTIDQNDVALAKGS